MLYLLSVGHLIQSAICLAPFQTSCDVRDIAEICRGGEMTKDTCVVVPSEQ